MSARASNTVAALVAAAVVFATTSAAAGTSTVKLDLSTPEAIDAYLVSKGIDPAKVVKQIGLKNYAGPTSGCPGLGWNCTTAAQVAQIALAGGENRAECTDDALSVTLTSQTCVIVQSAETNHAACREHLNTEPDAEQHCMITQSGQRNSAFVKQVINQSNGPTQRAVQTADVTQSDEGTFNHSQIHQLVMQSTRVGSTQAQDAHQVADVTQTATGSGHNDSHVHQAQKQYESGAATMQTQNAAGLPSGVVDCAFGPRSPSTPNSCAHVEQAADDGKNVSHLHQLSDQDIRSTLVTDIKQGTLTGGNDGQVPQVVSGSGSSRNHAWQKKRQDFRAPPTSTYFQSDPTGCCGLSQVGGYGNREDINQESTQSASGGSGSQVAMLTGSSNTEGSCVITHKARNNEASTSFSASEEPCPALVVETDCASGEVLEGGEGFCTSEEVAPPEDDILLLTTWFFTTPTYGREIEPLDVLAEPSSYTGT
jgi:hypothetical protein